MKWVDALNNLSQIFSPKRFTHETLKDINTSKDLLIKKDYDENDLYKLYLLTDVYSKFLSITSDIKQSFGYEELLDILRKLEKSNDQEKDFFQKISDVDSCLNWFETHTDDFTPGEVNVMGLVREIMVDGIFSITSEGLKVRNKDGKIYDMDDLKRHSGRLTLYSNQIYKDHKEVTESFHSRLNTLTRLINCLSELKKCGNLLFSDCKIEIFQNPQSDFNVKIDLLIADSILHGKKTILPDDHLKNICDQLENITREWRNHMTEKRNKYKLLNFFTNNQALNLQRDISHFLNKKVITNELFNLCQIITRNYTKDNIATVIKQLPKEIFKPHDNFSNGPADSNEKLIEEKNFDEKIYKLVIELKKYFDNENLILVAAKRFAHLDGDEAEDAAFEFCVQSEKSCDNNHKLADPLGEHMKKFTDKQSNDSSIAVKLYELWTEFLKTINFNNDYVSLDHLGIILDSLTASDNVFSKSSSNLGIFKPVLLICKQCDSWKTALMLFLSQHQFSLPTISQILLANENTTAEEVELICKRSLAYPDKIFVILNVQNLNYEAMNEAHRIFSDVESRDDGNLTYFCFYLAIF